MSGFFQSQVLGRVGRDPEMNYTPNGVAVTKFSVAVDRKQGEKESTVWVNCVAWRGLAETLSQHVHKGDMLFVQGDLDARQYTTRDGKPGVSLDLTIDRFAFAGSKGNREQAGASAVDNDPLGDLDEHPF